MARQSRFKLTPPEPSPAPVDTRLACGCRNGIVMRGRAGIDWPEPCAFCRGAGSVTVTRLVKVLHVSRTTITRIARGLRVKTTAARRLFDRLVGLAETYRWMTATATRAPLRDADAEPLLEERLMPGSRVCIACGGPLTFGCPPLAADFARHGFARLHCAPCAGYDVAAHHAAACTGTLGRRVAGCTCAHCSQSDPPRTRRRAPRGGATA